MNNQEKGFIEIVLKKYQAQLRTGLDIGCCQKHPKQNEDGRVFPEYFLGLDQNPNFEPDILLDFVKEGDKLESNKYPLILLSHMLEDCENPYDAMRTVFRITKDQGIVIIISPYRNKYFRLGHPYCNPGHRYDFTPRDMMYIINKVFHGQFDILEFADELSDRSFGVVIRKNLSLKRNNSDFTKELHERFPL